MLGEVSGMHVPETCSARWACIWVNVDGEDGEVAGEIVEVGICAFSDDDERGWDEVGGIGGELGDVMIEGVMEVDTSPVVGVLGASCGEAVVATVAEEADAVCEEGNTTLTAIKDVVLSVTPKVWKEVAI